MVYSIKDKEAFRVEPATSNRIYYGTNQEWYPKWMQRMSGCGPSAAANMIHYLNYTHADMTKAIRLSKGEYVELMKELWEFVTPGIGGVSSTEMFCKGFQKYINEKKLGVRLTSLNVPKKKELRPEMQQVRSFLIQELEKDSPVAFLNLEHGSVNELDSWHWVTIISFEDTTESQTAFVEILDGSYIKKIDLLQWLQTTKMGGGFVGCER